ncbi:MAG TPA: hypothetical protein VFR32_05530 [Gaiellaceae bacterium]|nr:hypothetical protein [Gaiellaceae bacterium]
MSTSSAEPSVSVVIGENGAGSVNDCLDPLRPLPGGLQVIVRNGGAPLVPEQWRDGIDVATGDIVCLTISVMRPAADWLETAQRLSAEAAAVGGAIEPGGDLRLRDWAEYFCRYARDMLPFPARETVDLPGDNAVYRRAALIAVSDTYRDGFWEPEVHRALAERGERLLHSPELVVYQGRSAGFRAFLRQRLVHGRAFGRQRGARFSTARQALGVALAPVVPLVLLARRFREVFSRRRLRLRLVASTPILLAYDVAWAAGEAAGYLDSLRSR